MDSTRAVRRQPLGLSPADVASFDESVLVFAHEMGRDLLLNLIGPMIMEQYGKEHQQVYKLPYNYALKLDGDVDDLIRKEIRRAFPEHEIYSEERPPHLTGSPWKWYVDPLDGTYNVFHRTSNHFGPLLALAYQDTPLLGISNAPLRTELCAGLFGRTTTLNGVPIVWDKHADPILAHAVIGTDCGKHDRTRIIPVLTRLLELRNLEGEDPSEDSASETGGEDLFGVGYCPCFMSAGIQLAMVAQGLLHGYIGVNLEPWDMAASVPQLLGAGKMVTNTKGEHWRIGDDTIVAAPPRLHEKLIAITSTNL